MLTRMNLREGKGPQCGQGFRNRKHAAGMCGISFFVGVVGVVEDQIYGTGIGDLLMLWAALVGAVGIVMWLRAIFGPTSA